MSDRERFDRNFLDAVPESRRAFLKKMAAVAFAAPVVSSFAMDSVALASGSGQYTPNQTDCGPGQYQPNGSYPRPKYPTGYFGNGGQPFYGKGGLTSIFQRWFR
jgi:hypothetical protein